MKRIVDLAVLASSCLVATLAAEGALRIAYARSLDFGMEMWKYAATVKRPVKDDRLRFEHAPSRRAHLMGVDLTTSSQGLRDRDFSIDKPAGVYRIAMLGDSTTLGWGCPQEETGARQLERALNAKAAGRGEARRYEVMNFGVGNYNTVQEVETYVAKARAFHPDLVVLQYFINDAEPMPPRSGGWLADHSYLRTFLASRVDGLLRKGGRLPNWEDYYRALYRDDQPGWPAAREALRRLAVETRRDGVPLVVTLLPELHRINDGYPFAEAHRLVGETLAAEGVPTVELIDGLRGHGPESALWVTPLDAHPNARAFSLITAQLVPWLRSREGRLVAR